MVFEVLPDLTETTSSNTSEVMSQPMCSWDNESPMFLPLFPNRMYIPFGFPTVWESTGACSEWNYTVGGQKPIY